VSGAATATFVYDGDGNRVKGTVDGVTITYIGNYYEWSGSTGTCKGRSVCPLIMSKIGVFTDIILEPDMGSDLPLLRRAGADGHGPGQYAILFVRRPTGQHVGGGQQQRE
jgi:hypothetical protein